MSYFTVLTELPLRDGGDVLPVPAASPPGVPCGNLQGSLGGV